VAGEHHNVDGGARLRVDDEGRGYWSRCTCGWESELCATAALAEAVAEQHVLFARRRPPGEGRAHRGW
jgi:hypothetical protein